MTHPAARALWLLAALGSCSTSSQGQERGPISVDLSTAGSEGAPAQFTFSPTGEGENGKWTLVGDLIAANGYALAQVRTDRTDHRFPLAIYQPYTGKDLEVSVRLKAVAGTVDEAGGIAVRLSTPDDYYVARANVLEDNVRFYRVVKGRRQQLAGANLKVTANQWHTLALKAEGDQFTSRLMARRCSRRRTEPSLTPAGSRCGPRPTTASPNFDTISITPRK